MAMINQSDRLAGFLWTGDSHCHTSIYYVALTWKHGSAMDSALQDLPAQQVIATQEVKHQAS
jgi:hypothetical protein